MPTKKRVRLSDTAALVLRLGVLSALTALSACGGGGSSATGPGGGSAPVVPVAIPLIRATLFTFSSSTAPGLNSGSTNTQAQVAVTDPVGTTPVTDATVTVNGVALSYAADIHAYSGRLTVNPGDKVSVSVTTVGGYLYAGTETQFATFPVVGTLITDGVWSTQMANVITWSGAADRANSFYAVGVLDATGATIWPAGGVFQSVTNGSSLVVPGSTLTAGNRFLAVGIVDTVPLQGAAQGSIVSVSAFGYSPVTITAFQANPSPLPPLSQAVAVQIDYAHSGRATVGGSGPTFPSGSSWTATLDSRASYPLIAEGKIFIVTAGDLHAGVAGSLYALNEVNGTIVWGPVTLPLLSADFAAHAYDHGKIFVISSDGLLSSYDAATGVPGWSENLVSNRGSLTGTPTAVNGIVYVGATDIGEIFAVDERNGALLWTASVNGDFGSLAVSSDGVFGTYYCQAYKFDPISGTQLWHYDSGGCTGGVGNIATVVNNKLYFRDEGIFPPSPKGRVLDTGTGTQIASFDSDLAPAVSDHVRFDIGNGTLTAVNLASDATVWNFTGDGQLITAPIIVDGTVVIASASGKVYALNADTGALIWNAMAGSTISYREGTSGMGVGDGYLVVPAGNTVTGWRLVQ